MSHKQEDLSLIPRASVKKLSVMSWTRMCSAGEVKTRRSLGLAGRQAIQIGELQGTETLLGVGGGNFKRQRNIFKPFYSL